MFGTFMLGEIRLSKSRVFPASKIRFYVGAQGWLAPLSELLPLEGGNPFGTCFEHRH